MPFASRTLLFFGAFAPALCLVFPWPFWSPSALLCASPFASHLPCSFLRSFCVLCVLHPLCLCLCPRFHCPLFVPVTTSRSFSLLAFSGLCFPPRACRAVLCGSPCSLLFLRLRLLSLRLLLWLIFSLCLLLLSL